MAKQQNVSENEQEQQNVSEKAVYTVIVEFKDSPEYQVEGQEQNVFKVGENVSDLDPVRLNSLVERGIVSKSE